jgi:hypothetical protein
VSHCLFALADATCLLGLFNHNVYPLDGLLAVLELSCDGLCHMLNLLFLALLDIFVVEPREDVLLVQLLKLPCLRRNVPEILGHFVLDVQPARGQQVHLDHGVPIVLVCAGGHEPAALLVAEAIGDGPAVGQLLLRVVRVGLAVRDVAVHHG